MGNQNGTAYVNGVFLPAEEASVPLLDWGFVKSDATYDVVAVWKGRFFRLDDHLDRFEASVASLSMTLPVSRDELKHILAECVRRSELENAYVSMTCTRGVPPPGSRDLRRFRNALYVYAIPYVWIFNHEGAGRLAHLHLSGIQRIPPQSVDPRVKNYHWLDLIRAKLDAGEHGADLPVLIDQQGNITEGFGFNVFAVRGGEVFTPEAGVLEGITRETVFGICAELGLALHVGPLPRDDFVAADEIFLTSTAGGVMPAGHLDGKAIGTGAPGPVTEKIRSTYWDRHADLAWTTAVSSL